MSFKVKGNSKYKLNLEDNIVTKSSEFVDNRLIDSAFKQNEFKSNFFKTPKIYGINDKSFSMEYIYGDSFIDFFARASKRDLDGFISKLDGYFKERIVGECVIPTNIIREKLLTIPESTEFLDKINNIDNIKIKVGMCHGDLTLSNMVFAEDIYLIDFLSSYIESPTMDIIKLRQDTHLYWSFNMVKNINDVIKLKIGLNYIDEWLVKNFDMEYYNLLQCVNLFRIYPYTNDPKIKEYLKTNINRLCEHL